MDNSEIVEQISKTKESDSLAELIKSTHKSLRTESQNKDDDEVQALWVKHTKNVSLLQEYSNAMHTLATEHWDQRNNVSRIKWIYDALKEYFFGGVLAIKLEKEARRISLLEPNALHNFHQKTRLVLRRYETIQKLRILDVGSCYNPFGKFEDIEVLPIDLCPANSEVYRCDFLALKIIEGEDKSEDIPSRAQELPKSERQEEKTDFEPEHKRRKLETKNDLTSSDKFHCDENAEKNDRLNESESEKVCLIECCKKKLENSVNDRGRHCLTETETNISINKNNASDISELVESSFDSVIFSFFLEYIPTAKLRYECCLKAYRLLKPGGALCIVTPDSKHLTGNILFFKLWKSTLSLVGFERIKYEKCLHFHAMVFRKVIIPSTLKEHAESELKSLASKQFFTKFSKLDWNNIHNSMYIIQDMQS